MAQLQRHNLKIVRHQAYKRPYKVRVWLKGRKSVYLLNLTNIEGLDSWVYEYSEFFPN